MLTAYLTAMHIDTNKDLLTRTYIKGTHLLSKWSTSLTVIVQIFQHFDLVFDALCLTNNLWNLGSDFSSKND